MFGLIFEGHFNGTDWHVLNAKSFLVALSDYHGQLLLIHTVHPELDRPYFILTITHCVFHFVDEQVKAHRVPKIWSKC